MPHVISFKFTCPTSVIIKTIGQRAVMIKSSRGEEVDEGEWRETPVNYRKFPGPG